MPSAEAFDRASFNHVKEYLGKQATYFEYAEDWFGPDGLLTAMNMQVLIAGIDALNSTAELMEIKHESVLDMILDAIFGDILAIVGAIPVVGPAISAVLHIGMSTAKIIIKANDHSLSFKASVAEMEEALTDILQSMTDATAKQYADVTGNYGKLEAFATNVINGTISAQGLGVRMAVNGGSDAASLPKLPAGYITALGKGWEIAFFKRMYSLKFKPSVDMWIADDSPRPIQWSPADKNYTYDFTMPATFLADDKKAFKGVIWGRCTPNGSQEVHNRLFGADQLAVDPVSFFFGVDGWDYIMPILDRKRMSIYANAAYIASMP